MRELMLVPRNIVSPQANKPVMGIVQVRGTGIVGMMLGIESCMHTGMGMVISQLSLVSSVWACGFVAAPSVFTKPCVRLQ